MTNATAVASRLEALYGRASWQPNHRALDELIQTILSQHTSDTNSERAFHELKRHYPTWEAVRTASVEDIAGAIRSGGLAEMKARRIRAVLEELGDGELDGLETLPLAAARQRLTSLPGVGPKTAACVLLFACGLPALPVDTHVHRVALRLGLLPARMNAEKAHAYLERQLDPDDVYNFHVNMIRHGRTICRASRPRCPDCGLRDLCDFATTNSD